MSEFNLQHHIRAILAETDETQIGELVDIVFRRTARRDLAEAYRQALPNAVRNALVASPRNVGINLADLTEQDAKDLYAAATREAPSIDPFTAAQPPNGNQRPANNLRNSRVALLRRNRFRISVWVGGGVYREILDCTIDDLLFATDESDRKAAANAAAAERYRRLVKAMQQHGAEKVADLTDEQITEALGQDSTEGAR
jgi:RES domain-containing protein